MIFYTREDCPLCEDVEETLIALKIDYHPVDIDLDESLLKKYNAKIPVLVCNNKELYYPFTTEQLKEFTLL